MSVMVRGKSAGKYLKLCICFGNDISKQIPIFYLKLVMKADKRNILNRRSGFVSNTFRAKKKLRCHQASHTPWQTWIKSWTISRIHQLPEARYTRETQSSKELILSFSTFFIYIMQVKYMGILKIIFGIYTRCQQIYFFKVK